MKTRFNTLDIRVAVNELRNGCLGLRVANVYDIDNKTYIIKLAKPDSKLFIVLESGNKIHLSQFDWPKNTFPSGFSMKLRKHLRTRRLESVEQLGVDRIIDLQFGSNEAAYHIILELYDRGNIVLTDCEYNILNVLRQRTDESQDVRFAVNEKYPLELAKQKDPLMAAERLHAILSTAKEGDNIKRVLIPHVCYGPPLIEHCLIGAGFSPNVAVGKGFNIEEDIPKLISALIEAEDIFTKLGQPSKGFIIQKKEKKPKTQEGDDQELLTYDDFSPCLFRQHEKQPYIELETFNKAVDEFFSKHESQKFDRQALQQEKSALKKLENVKKDHEKRLDQLQHEQDMDKRKAQLIELNLTLVDRAIAIVRSALANQIDWAEIQNIVKEAQIQGDPVAKAIKGLKLDINHITMLLGLPYSAFGSDDDDDDEDNDDDYKPMKIDLDLSLSAYANARKYFDMKKSAAVKEQKTVAASSKALKSAERKTKETLKEVATKVSIQKLRKVHWFEKFLWFVTSENFLVIAGRDQQQNEIIYKRYLRPGDIYVHADLHGASSIVVKNHTKDPIPPKTLNEAGTMAICNSAAWDAKVVTSAWWVYHNQVSKTAPTGEYLTTGSFMIRGKKNYLPPSHLVYGFGVLFKLDDGSVFRHKGERQVRMAEEDKISETDSVTMESEADTVDLDISDSDSDESEASTSSNKVGEVNEVGECEMNTEERTLDDTGLVTVDGTAGCDNVTASVDNLRVEDLKDTNGSKIDSESSENVVEDGQGTGGAVGVVSGDAKQENVELKDETTEETVDDEDEGGEGEMMFPDTTISLSHVAGDKYELQRCNSTSYQEEPEIVEDKPDVKLSQRLTAKQRRELKKKKNKGQPDMHRDVTDEFNTDEAVHTKPVEAKPEEEDEDTPDLDDGGSVQSDQHQSQQQQPPPKRGQRAKMKKIKKKYADQDEDERQLRMDILASAGKQVEEPKKKGKKGKLQQQQQRQQQKAAQQQKQQATQKQRLQQQRAPGSASGGMVMQEGDVVIKEAVEKATEKDGNLSDEEKQAVLEDENITLLEDADILDSLTGLPHAEDELLYAIPYCAPYSMLLNFKYKVKLTPGNTKRGKAAKTALHMFTVDRTASSREKDLLKSIKDSDLSRNLPGKVKVSAPNLQKSKGKR